MMRRRRLVVTILAALLAILMLLPIMMMIVESVSAHAVSQSQIDAKKEEQQSIADQKSELKGQISELQEKQASVIEQKTALDKQNELTRQEIEVITEQIDLYEQMIKNKEAELVEAIAAEERQMELYRTRMRAMEENGTLSYLAILFEATSFSDFLTRLDMITEIMEYDKQLELDYIAAREYVEQVKAEFEQAKLEEEEAKLMLLDRKAQLEREIEEAYQLILKIENEIDEYRKEVEAAEAAERALQSEIDNLVAELQRQEAAAKAAAEAGGGTYTGINATGQFIWPLPSNTTPGNRGFGYQLHPIFNEMRFHAGQDVGGATGASIVAMDSGTVAVATFNSSYGNYVMLNHGNGTTTLYAHMSSYAVTVGQSVNQGDVIGYVGSTGWSTGPHLHFEVRVGGNLVDPMSYFR